MEKAKKTALYGVMISLALALSYVERFIPLQMLIPLPGIKLGLANIVTLSALYLFGKKSAYAILIVRCLLGASFGGGISGLVFSLAGGMLALWVMVIGTKISGLSIFGVSILGAAAHNVGQICAAILLMKSIYIGAYLPYLLVVGVFTGFATASAAAEVLRILTRTSIGTDMKKVLILVIALSTFLSGCGVPAVAKQQKQYTATFMTLFDTVTTIVGSAESEEVFYEKAKLVYEELEEYHQLFDIYKEYEGVVNLKTINDQAGIAPVKVDEPIIRLLQDCRTMYEMTDGRVNVAMGGVLSLWHEARDHGRSNPKEASLPEMHVLREAAEHMDPETVIIDAEASTVYIEDPLVQLDVGAIAKGWAVQKVAENAPEGMLISVGGNVCVTGAKDQKGNPWIIGIQNPSKEDEFLHTVYVKEGSVVTSGDYQRTYQVDGKMYHHIIDPDTLYPAEYWRSVTVICQDSGVADTLSTALFLMSLEDGQQLLKQCQAEAMWVDLNGDISYSPGFKKYI